MKLDQKQMHLISQLFMAASKAGHSFDLGRFTKDASYAGQTVSQLALLAEQKGQEPLQGLVILVMDLLTHITPAATPVVASTAPMPQPASIAPSADMQRYVGKLR